MIINHKHKFIFIHIPKCAGTSVAKALYPYCDEHDTFLGCHPDAKEEIVEEDGFRIHKHSNAEEIKKYTTPQRWEEYFVFSFVRNPIDRIISFYEWWRETPGNWDIETKEVISKMSFKEFVFSKYTSRQQIELLTSRGEEKEHFVQAKYRLEIDFIGKQESLNRDFAYVCGLLKLPLIELKKDNVSRKRLRDNNLYLDDEIRREIRRKYHTDFSCFRYKQ